MATIYDTEITVYRGTDFDPDGNPVPWRFEAAFFDDADSDFTGEYLFNVTENGELYPIGPVGNAVVADSAVTYKNYQEMIAAESGHNT